MIPALVIAVAAAMPSPSLSQGLLPDPAPLPFAPPARPSAALDALNAASSTRAPAPSQQAIRLIEALDALDRGDVPAARALRESLRPGSAERQAASWAFATSGNAASSEIMAAMRELRDWPGADDLRAQLERTLHRERASPDQVSQVLGDAETVTPEGIVLHMRGHLAAGDEEAARALLGPYWRSTRLEARHESAILREFGDILGRQDHRIRMERMLYADRIASAERVAGLAGATELARAFAAVTRNAGNARSALDAVPEAQRGAAYAFALSRHLRRSGKYREAAKVMLDAPTDREAIVDPDAWWIERRVLSREMLDLGEPATAYAIAAAHAAESKVHAVDAEFHAGWYAFRWTGDAAKGAGHFRRIIELAEGPISSARGYYWLGRAAEAGAPGDASSFYEQAAHHGATFYGQLAAAKLGRDTTELSPAAATDADQRRFKSRAAVKAVRIMEAAGQVRRANALYAALAREIDSPGELRLLTGMAEAKANHFLALRIAKQAVQRGVDVGDLAHPVGAIPADASASGPGAALAYAVARQESEFNVGARSGAGALGLLQLLPGTAREMARKTGAQFVAARLTTDGGYNAALGTAYLDEQLARFSGSYILTFIGYNAGPRRAQEWMARYGDPRGEPIEAVVDWIERIPYTETRGYVQRVMENYQVYKMRLTGRMDIAGDLVNGRADATE